MFLTNGGIELSEADQLALGIRSRTELGESERKRLKEVRKAQKLEKRFREASSSIFADIIGNARAGEFAARGR